MEVLYYCINGCAYEWARGEVLDAIPGYHAQFFGPAYAVGKGRNDGDTDDISI
jgi:hypothetical protein